MSPEPQMSGLTPREVVAELDKFIVGQHQAKRAVAIALRNRWRRRRVPEPMRDEISPKNIILIGATGVGKTEIARRLARLAQAPFVKVEASKFTEVGYMGRDCEAMVRDLVEASVAMVRQEAQEKISPQAEQLGEDRLLDLLLPRESRTGFAPSAEAGAGDEGTSRERLREMLRRGALDDREVDIELAHKPMPSMSALGQASPEEMGSSLQDMLGQIMGQKRPRRRRLRVAEARGVLREEEAQRLIDSESVNQEAVQRASDSGIIFLDEIDKIARREGNTHGPDISREGVQRDILPIVEGSRVTTKYGTVDTQHVLFIAAGAFHVSKVSDLIPELQGRFPIRVELEALTEDDLLRILKEPQNALPAQYAALLATEGVDLTFTEAGLKKIACMAFEANSRSENIGARRLHTVFEKLLETILFAGPDRGNTGIEIDADYVAKELDALFAQEDLARYIL